MRLVRHVARADAPVVGHPVGPRHVVHGVQGEPGPFDGIRAHVGQEDVVDGHDRPVPPERDPRPVDLLAVVARGGEVLAPTLDPLHGPPEAEGDGRHEELLVIDGALRAEAAPHVGGEHPHLLGRDPEDHGHRVAHEVGILGGRPDDQQAGLGVPVGEDAARLDRHGGDPRMAELFLDDQVGGGKGPLDVAGRRRARRRRRCRASRREPARPRARRTRASSPAGAGRSRPRSRRGRRPADRRSSATTTATGSPTYRTTSDARTLWT